VSGFDIGAARQLKACRSILTKQQYKTLKGQILAGDSAGAMKGLEKLRRTASCRNSTPSRSGRT
jgi:hypothetical protein